MCHRSRVRAQMCPVVNKIFESLISSAAIPPLICDGEDQPEVIGVNDESGTPAIPTVNLIT